MELATIENLMLVISELRFNLDGDETFEELIYMIAWYQKSNEYIFQCMQGDYYVR